MPSKKIKKITSNFEELTPTKEDEIIKKALLKKAQGFVLQETVEEYSTSEDKDDMVLTKRKITTKEIPPDILAIKYLIDGKTFDEDYFSSLTDEQLEQEKNKLLKLLGGENED